MCMGKDIFSNGIVASAMKLKVIIETKFNLATISKEYQTLTCVYSTERKLQTFATHSKHYLRYKKY